MMVKLKIPFAESWNFCAATPRKEVMKTDMLDDSVSFHTNTNTHTNKYIMRTDMLDDSVSFHTNTNTHTNKYLMKMDMLDDSLSFFLTQIQIHTQINVNTKTNI